MQARIDVENDVSIVRLSGYLDFETTIPFQKSCLSQVSTDKVIFDFEALHFVGSCGLTSFVQSLSEFASTQTRRPRFAKASIEFRKLMTTMFFLDTDFHETVVKAKDSFVFSDHATVSIDQNLRLPNQWESESLFDAASETSQEEIQEEVEAEAPEGIADKTTGF